MPNVERAWAYAWSIVLEAAPYILVGAIAATCVARIAHRHVFAAALVAIAPGCDCTMNGFAHALRSLPAPLASGLMMWGSCANPIAVLATMQILGPRVALARLAGALVVASLAIAISHAIRLAWMTGDGCDARRGDAGPLAHAEKGLISILPAAAIGGALLVFSPIITRLHASPWMAALSGAVLSPCSTADPVLASALCATTAAQAAFVVAAQCADLRQLILLRRSFGNAGALVGLASGAAGCAAAVFVGR